ncbi:Phosphotransferase enzyme family protein [Nocardiopsis flavescens]|uniref:Phosphotransferase enzyme family protein n=1 Tax=Nocardiopsis flavescens TaxID=758803 RepID=A0A1M6AKJ0_9ACTN|nr:phosphotransferase [Nocardiopsis flavescens]SHI36937.1 Phosphotransferase enzyme family protein [Nocardiopsis flavescens]
MRSLLTRVPALLGDPDPALDVRELRGGTKKGVWRLTLAGGSTVVAYLWHPDHDGWPAGSAPADPADPFSHASGPELFAAARAHLVEAGVRVPDLYALDGSGPGTLAVVEDAGPTLEHLLAADPAGAAPVLEHLAGGVRALHARTRAGFGGLTRPAVGGSCHGVVLERALADLEEAAGLDARAAAARPRLEEELHARAARVRPRGGGYALVHGELGPDHVLAAPGGQAVLIDIEGLMYFDAEWEHVFLRLRFGDLYPRLAVADLDPCRMDLYALALDLSLVAGPLRYLRGPAVRGREEMARIAEYALGRALAPGPGRAGW